MEMVLSSSNGVVFVTILIYLHLAHAGQICGQCNDVTEPRMCQRVTRCADNDECMVQLYRDSLKHEIYQMGCASHLTGQNNSNVVECTERCNETKACNILNGLCGSQRLNKNGGILCYRCPFMNDPDDCLAVHLCGSWSHCYVGQFQMPLSTSVFWESYCKTNCSSATSAFPIVVGKRASPSQGGQLYSACCNGSDLCNTACKGISSTKQPLSTPPTDSRPVITSISPTQHVQIGSTVRLSCRATGHPTPAVYWNFFALGSQAPDNVHVENNGSDIVITNFRQENYGHYACKAQNAVGNDVRYIDILQK